MSLLSFRKDRVDQVVSGKYAPSQATVTTFRAGAVVNGNQGPVSTFDVRRAHRFPTAGGVKTIVMRYSGGVWSMLASSYRSVTSATDTTITVDSPLTVLDGDYFVNIGNDTGIAAPLFDSSPVKLYVDPEGKTTAFSQSSVTPNVKGDYWYFTREDRLWDVVRTGSSPIAMILDTVLTEDYPARVRYAHRYATSGSGVSSDPWVTSGSNPVQAALDALPNGGKVVCIGGYYTLGNAAVAVTVPQTLSASDPSQWSIIGDGKDNTVFNYSGTGTAIRIAQVNSGSFQSSRQGNQYVLRGFGLRQTGTPKTGIGLELQYVTHSIFEELSIGRLRSDHVGGANNDVGFAYGVFCHGIADPADNVSDWNQFRSLFLLGNGVAMDMAKFIDATLFYNLWVEPDQATAAAQQGIRVYNAHAVTFQACHFNFFNDAVDSTALQFWGYTDGVNISGCYFEDNIRSIVVGEVLAASLQDTHSFNVNACYIAVCDVATAPFASYGIKLGSGSGTWKIRACNIIGNTFQGIRANCTGIRVDSDVEDYHLIGNHYFVNGGTAKTFIHGSNGFEFEPEGAESNSPGLHMRSEAPFTGYITLENTDTANNGNSPGIIFRPGGPGARLRFRIEQDANGQLEFYDDSGNVIGVMTQTGDFQAFGNLRRSVQSGITASTTHTQVAATALTKDVNNVTVCANASDAVKLPSAASGMSIVITNNGAQPLAVWPASGDDAGSGVDTVHASTLASASNRRYVAIDSTNWEVV